MFNDIQVFKQKLMALLIAISIMFVFVHDIYAEEEVIKHFNVDIQLNLDGSLNITENIKVYAKGNHIERGIYKSLKKESGIYYEFLSVTRDGNKEHFKVENNGDEVFLYIGKQFYFLEEGYYEYIIEYKTYGHLIDGADYDEIYWNITGDKWPFVIENSKCVIRWPKKANKIKAHAFVGSRGSKGKDYQMVNETNHSIEFITTRGLSSNEGWTIGIAFTKGVLKSALPPYVFNLFFGGALLFCVVLITVIMSYVLEKRNVKERPPTDHMPKEISPAFLYILYKKSYDSKAIAVSLISLAIKGYVEVIKKKSKDFTVKLIKQKKQWDDKVLYDDEKLILKALAFPKKINTKSNRSQWQALDNKLNIHFKADKYKIIKQTYWWLLKPIITLLMWAFLFNLVLSPAAFWDAIPITVCLLIFITVGSGVQKSSGIPISGRIVFMLMFTLMPIVAWHSAMSPIIETPWYYITLYMASYVLSILTITSTLNKRGKEYMAYSKAFANYLFLSKTFDINKESLDLYEQYLPFVIAMGREKKWTKKFKEVFKEIDCKTNFYSGDTSINYISLSSFQSSLSSTISDASIIQSSGGGSSGGSSFSGGGSSGGGGGSSGGGGW